MITNIEQIAQVIETDKVPMYAPVMTVGPDIAAEWVNGFNHSHQRPFRPFWGKFLTECMKRGKFRPYTMICFAVLEGKPILVNGQHTLSAIHSSKQRQQLLVQFQRVESERELEALYSGFDNHMKRSLRDQMGEIGEEMGLGDKEKNALAVAVKFMNTGMRLENAYLDPVKEVDLRDAEFVKNEMRSWAYEAAEYFKFLRGMPKANHERFMRAHIVSVGLLTLRHANAKAIDFWSEAMLDDGLRIGDPRKTFFTWLGANPVAKSRNLQSRAAIACWNAWYKNKELHRVMPATEAAERALGCDPYYASFSLRQPALEYQGPAQFSTGPSMARTELRC